jgi:osmotically-inducible protein OsmY
MQDMLLLENLEEELNWDPEVTADHIAVNVNQGAVTLTGYVTTYPEKLAAVRAAERVYGVQAVADDIQVRPIASATPDDSQICEAIMNSFRWRANIPEWVKAEVEDGWVTLRGEDEWDYERRESPPPPRRDARREPRSHAAWRLPGCGPVRTSPRSLAATRRSPTPVGGPPSSPRCARSSA